MKDPNCPVFSPNYYPADDEEIIGAIGTFETGDAYYYIPPFPFSGEVETYNFLFSEAIWKKDERLGMVSPIRKLRILNANQSFSNDSQIDEFIKTKAEKLGIEVIYGATLN